MRLTPSSTPIDLFSFTKISEREVCIATRKIRKMLLFIVILNFVGFAVRSLSSKFDTQKR